MGNYRQADIARRLGQIINEMSQMDRRIKAQENDATFGDDATIEQLPCPYIFFPVRVTSISTASRTFLGQIQKSGSSPFWTDDTSIATPLTVAVPTNVALPSANDIVRADYTGSYDSNYSPRYGLFSASAVGSITTSNITVIVSVAIVGDMLVTQTRDLAVISYSTVNTTSQTFGEDVALIDDVGLSGVDFQKSSRTVKVIVSTISSGFTTYHSGTLCTSS